MSLAFTMGFTSSAHLEEWIIHGEVRERRQRALNLEV